MSRVFFLLLFSGLLFSAGLPSTETYTFSGKVFDLQQNALSGARVQIKGSLIQTTTASDGSFTLKHREKKATLLISAPGFETQEVEARAGTLLELSLSPVQEEEALELTQRASDRMERAKKASVLTAPYGGVPPASSGIVPYRHSLAQESQPDFQTEDYDFIQENRFYEVRQQALSTFSIDVDAASYSNVRRFLKNGQQPPKDAVRIEEMVNYFDYQYPEPKGEQPFSVTMELGECPWQPEHRLLHVGLQGKHIPADHLPASNLVFLIDVSGSMNQPNKLPLLQASFKLLVDQLREQDRVAIAVYAGAAGTVLAPTSGSEKQKIKDAISELQAGGSTAGAAGIQLAYNLARENFIKGGNNRVILATDGDFNVGASSDAELVRLIEQERQSGVFLTVLGFGMGNYKDNKMQQLADKGNGNHAYIDDISEAKKVLVREFGGTIFTIAKDVKIQIEFNPAHVRGYRLIGYENRVMKNEEFNDDKKDAGEMGSGHTVTALYELIPNGVESAYLGKVDELKYQTTAVDPKAARSPEWCTVKLRYKQPDGEQSQLIQQTVVDGKEKGLDRSSENFRWSAAVAEFGMLLRGSEYRGKATYLHCRRLAESAKGADPHGDRREFIDLLDVMRSLADPELAGKE